MSRTVVIDCFPESAAAYKEGYAVVAIEGGSRPYLPLEGQAHGFLHAVTVVAA